MKGLEIARALRCISTVNPEHNCEECPYRVLEETDDVLGHNVVIDGKEYWQTCDFDRIGIEAAEFIEEMIGAKNESN